MTSKPPDFISLTRSGENLFSIAIKWVEEPGNAKVGIAFFPSSEVKLVFQSVDGKWKVVAGANMNDIQTLNDYVRNGRLHGIEYVNLLPDLENEM